MFNKYKNPINFILLLFPITASLVGAQNLTINSLLPNGSWEPPYSQARQIHSALTGTDDSLSILPKVDSGSRSNIALSGLSKNLDAMRKKSRSIRDALFHSIRTNRIVGFIWSVFALVMIVVVVKQLSARKAQVEALKNMPIPLPEDFMSKLVEDFFSTAKTLDSGSYLYKTYQEIIQHGGEVSEAAQDIIQSDETVTEIKETAINFSEFITEFKNMELDSTLEHADSRESLRALYTALQSTDGGTTLDVWGHDHLDFGNHLAGLVDSARIDFTLGEGRTEIYGTPEGDAFNLGDTGIPNNHGDFKDWMLPEGSEVNDHEVVGHEGCWKEFKLPDNSTEPTALEDDDTLPGGPYARFKMALKTSYLEESQHQGKSTQCVLHKFNLHKGDNLNDHMPCRVISPQEVGGLESVRTTGGLDTPENSPDPLPDPIEALGETKEEVVPNASEDPDDFQDNSIDDSSSDLPASPGTSPSVINHGGSTGSGSGDDPYRRFKDGIIYYVLLSLRPSQQRDKLHNTLVKLVEAISSSIEVLTNIPSLEESEALEVLQDLVANLLEATNSAHKDIDDVGGTTNDGELQAMAQSIKNLLASIRGRLGKNGYSSDPGSSDDHLHTRYADVIQQSEALLCYLRDQVSDLTGEQVAHSPAMPAVPPSSEVEHFDPTPTISPLFTNFTDVLGEIINAITVADQNIINIFDSANLEVQPESMLSDFQVAGSEVIGQVDSLQRLLTVFKEALGKIKNKDSADQQIQELIEAAIRVIDHLIEENENLVSLVMVLGGQPENQHEDIYDALRDFFIPLDNSNPLAITINELLGLGMLGVDPFNSENENYAEADADSSSEDNEGDLLSPEEDVAATPGAARFGDTPLHASYNNGLMQPLVSTICVPEADMQPVVSTIYVVEDAIDYIERILAAILNIDDIGQIPDITPSYLDDMVNDLGTAIDNIAIGLEQILEDIWESYKHIADPQVQLVLNGTYESINNLIQQLNKLLEVKRNWERDLRTSESYDNYIELYQMILDNLANPLINCLAETNETLVLLMIQEAGARGADLTSTIDDAYFRELLDNLHSLYQLIELDGLMNLYIYADGYRYNSLILSSLSFALNTRGGKVVRSLQRIRIMSTNHPRSRKIMGRLSPVNELLTSIATCRAILGNMQHERPGSPYEASRDRLQALYENMISLLTSLNNNIAPMFSQAEDELGAEPEDTPGASGSDSLP
jgi:hypothetical protein